MTVSLALIWPAITSAFLASLVEAVEALTIVLAVATVRGWRPAGLGVVAGLVLLVLIVVVLGPLLDFVPLQLLQLTIGISTAAVRHALVAEGNSAVRGCHPAPR